jgi:hypothetical protein
MALLNQVGVLEMWRAFPPLSQEKCARRCDWVWDCSYRPQLVWKVHGGVGCGSRSNDPLPHPLSRRYSTSLQQPVALPWAIPMDGSGGLGHAIKRSSGSRPHMTWSGETDDYSHM